METGGGVGNFVMRDLNFVEAKQWRSSGPNNEDQSR